MTEEKADRKSESHWDGKIQGGMDWSSTAQASECLLKSKAKRAMGWKLSAQRLRIDWGLTGPEMMAQSLEFLLAVEAKAAMADWELTAQGFESPLELVAQGLTGLVLEAQALTKSLSRKTQLCLELSENLESESWGARAGDWELKCL